MPHKSGTGGSPDVADQTANPGCRAFPTIAASSLDPVPDAWGGASDETASAHETALCLRRLLNLRIIVAHRPSAGVASAMTRRLFHFGPIAPGCEATGHLLPEVERHLYRRNGFQPLAILPHPKNLRCEAVPA